MNNNVRILLVMESERRRPFIDHLKGRGALVLVAQTCLEAHSILSVDRSIELVLTDTTLSDGNWLTVLNGVLGRESKAAVVVGSNSRLTNVQLPVHVLAYGAFAVLSDPHTWQELDRIIATTAADNQTPSQSHPEISIRTGRSIRTKRRTQDA